MYFSHVYHKKAYNGYIQLLFSTFKGETISQAGKIFVFSISCTALYPLFVML